ncbi:MAG: hypothetical protein LBR80_04820 [Deltaproteobacteria bacterium]|jgi:hypothetical protein|nr:hypothetical protein [Deltaproteobacteria bacterium]
MNTMSNHDSSIIGGHADIPAGTKAHGSLGLRAKVLDGSASDDETAQVGKALAKVIGISAPGSRTAEDERASGTMARESQATEVKAAEGTPLTVESMAGQLKLFMWFGGIIVASGYKHDVGWQHLLTPPINKTLAVENHWSHCHAGREGVIFRDYVT